jgi:cytochrome c5
MKADSTTQLNRVMIKQLTLIVCSCLVLAACGNGADDQATSQADTDPETGLTAFEMEHGIGPITERIEIPNEIDQSLVDQGRTVYEMKCEACHNMESRMVGPAMGNITEQRSAEFIMNFILNPSGMIRDHPIGQELLEEYRTPMPYQNVDEAEARAILEYLRYYAESN